MRVVGQGCALGEAGLTATPGWGPPQWNLHPLAKDSCVTWPSPGPWVSPGPSSPVPGDLGEDVGTRQTSS